MANIRILTAVRNAMLDQLVAAMNAGAGPATLKLYSGSQPANANAALAGNTLLATLTFSNPSAPAAASGVISFQTITEDSAANATATATFGRIQDSDGNVIFDGDAGTSGAMIVLNTTLIVTGGPVRISSFTITMPSSMSF